MTYSRSELEEIEAALGDQLIDPCQICGRSRKEHGNVNIVHEYCPPGAQVKLVKSSQQSRESHQGNRQGSQGVLATSPQAFAHDDLRRHADPVLRMVLIRKGLISPADLDEVEQELRVSGAVFGEVKDDPVSISDT